MTISTTTDDTARDALEAVTTIVKDMSAAWNAADATAFATAFADDAEFVAFEGTVLPGRAAITAFHQPLFDTVLEGSALSPADICFARLLGDDGAVVHNRVSVTLPGEDHPSPSRDSMQLFVLRRTDGRWVVESMQNSRIISLQRQGLLDGMDALSTEDAARVDEFVTQLAHDGAS